MASNDSSGYRVLGPIGSGGTADIYEAVSEHGESGSTKVAIKRFSENVATPEFLDRFLEESRSLIALSHPGIVRVLDYGVSEGRPFPLEYTVDRKRIVIKELRVDDGVFTVVLAPPIPAAVMPRPR